MPSAALASSFRPFDPGQPSTPDPVVSVSWGSIFPVRLARKPKAQACAHCRFWDSFDEHDPSGAGLCRRFALAPTYDAWPITEAADRCGDWAQAEAPARQANA
ncbi:hypothetical protein [Novosphingobium mangrovi (ex Huang et al. 2023)]|uniref:Uncharacterized protein n=1 Tax=Novosphingobium mangrovi (ex Huang et al. 2023) TaxID=2976432 RepID=A0ABT2I568_9SPHN|nr:hypothetical protein [Novosphingobium mangrovi (ex Huang et al. 2023)]MCT2399748.1 hypothetical protein [Novosphingobium mangrovi (ex Huang et al. 2023)]